jgi:hypothetical protein
LETVSEFATEPSSSTSSASCRDRQFENQTYRASGLNLLVAAIILWNTAILKWRWRTSARPTKSRATSRRWAGEHISLTGDCASWNVEDRPDPDAFAARCAPSDPCSPRDVRYPFALTVQIQSLSCSHLWAHMNAVGTPATGVAA